MRVEVAAAMKVDITMLGGFSIRVDGAEVNPAECGANRRPRSSRS